MDESNPIKEILYKKLNQIGEQKIQLDISKGNSSRVIEEIFSSIYHEMEELPGSFDEKAGILAESLLHYLLTISLIPSQRKVVHENVDIDIVIPDLSTLSNQSKDSLLICFPKTGKIEDVSKRIIELEKVQSIKENIWLVLHKDLGLDLKTYQVNDKILSFSKIIEDINKFISAKKQFKFKILKS